MARWRLTGKHYINAERFGEPTHWVREETNRDTGRTNRKTFIVPLFLDPDNPQDWNYPNEIIVARSGTKYPNDIIYDGPPTPDMEPLDEEAEKLSEVEKPKWIHPIESLPGNGETYSEALLAVLTKQLEAASKNAASIPAAASVSVQAFEKMQAEMKALMETNAKLAAQVSKLAAGKAA